MNCPVCHGPTDMTDFAWIQGHHIFRCKQCGNWLEEISVLRTLPRANHDLLAALDPAKIPLNTKKLR